MDTLQQVLGRIFAETAGPGFYDISDDVDEWLRERRARDGLLTVFIRHTSASLVIQEAGIAIAGMLVAMDKSGVDVEATYTKVLGVIKTVWLELEAVFAAIIGSIAGAAAVVVGLILLLTKK